MNRPRRPGKWYFVVVIASVGLFAAIPFAHAAHRLRRKALWLWTAAYAALGTTLMIIVPPSEVDHPEGSAQDVLSSVVGAVAVATVVAACLQLSRVRREVYALPEPVLPPARPADPWASDPAVAAALAMRAKRDQARALAASDPVLARDLRIGRPDLPRQYDDGGLLDINTAPPQLIAAVCELDATAAQQIEDARRRHPVPFGSVDELLVFADLDVSTWDRLRDRAVVIP
ncbi:hypothetical protein [Saccharothrix coeruleofusca]|uniref:Helix-hairpin-helix protein n=1 Tax=Saccharothrix coeruleofusca TaxID=33919 RepID=A0A918AUP1_9PSEU|nr:hypothetical protein [Saccharothrix coeruleofusca]MBP2334582.1 hypothetical protein [Saccharothrix coeruleofusca]GGP73407.1 hypothetical protein GCM10010185_53670 [Saccharothrix coeruleofusca]